MSYKRPALSEVLNELLGEDFREFMKPSAQPERRAKHELVGSILSKEESMGIVPNGARYDELVDMSIEELHNLEVITTDKKHYKQNP